MASGRANLSLKHPVWRAYVAATRKLNGEWAKTKYVYATFRMELDARQWADQLKQRNPTWLIECKLK